ncbi:unnamed protein product [Triticum aestivum]|uniref:NPH3 domain-containing protein n=3 Tax=Triticinae TaxID=1648030 RepID=A0A9R1JF04_WHEAT|nr:BTB/POZ domain-containing protein At3g49900-like [Triticum aestivum]KAF7015054.1 hypothetical protein CFC21_028970 [Triticum aestivum]KAF7015055.1 hypothetical protein CFC21_028971 [Triticum aestivum]SPT17156.1 unnamed protein product [Triticum aestivum]
MAMEMGRSWQELGVVDTIYEDDHEEEDEEEETEDCFNSPTMSSSAPTSASCSPAAPSASSSLPPALRTAVQGWSRANGSRKPDVIVRVQEHCFHLHRDPITSESSYLKRQLSECSDIAVDLPAGLTVDAFADAVASCYGADLALSPDNLAAAWAAADWLELTAEDGLARRAEDYFFEEVATDHGLAAAVLRSCAAFLGGEAAGAGAGLLVRCLETLAASGGADSRWLEDVAALPLEEFQVVVEGMRARLAHDHDLMYTIVDHYLENHKGKLTEEEKSRLCYNVNCAKLSHHLFMHLVQNPRLPLRFVVQAMLVEQLHSHHSMLLTQHHHAAAAAAPASAAPLPLPPGLHKRAISGAFSSAVAAATAGDAANMTLGDILQRDAVLRQSAHIRASMDATGHRIDTLERELAGLRCRLRRSEQAAAAATASAAIDRVSAKSASFRIPRSRLWNGEDLSSSTATTGRSAAKGNLSLKSRLVHGFKSLFGRRPGNGVALPPARSDDAGTDVRVGEKGACASCPPEPEDGYDKELRKEEWSARPHRRNLSMV